MRQRFSMGLVSNLAILLVTLLTITGCSKTEFRLDEVIHIRHQGADMPAYIHGNSESEIFIVVLHGAGSFGLSFRDGAFTEDLEENYVVVHWDQRGQGMSQGRYGQTDDLVNLMAEDVIALATLPSLLQRYPVITLTGWKSFDIWKSSPGSWISL